ncbi:MAG TPA: hypothetical protein VF648_20305 [Pyrinomonadaceae bacterium]|jgi:hypothetical protein
MRKSVLGYTIAVVGGLIGLFYLTTATYKAALMQDKTTLIQRQEKPKSKVLNKEVKQLLETIRNRNLVTESPDKLAQAIEALGQRQITEAIPELIDFLDFRRIHKWEGTGVILHPLPKEGDYPAVGALFSIGKLALPALIKVVEENDIDSIKSKNALQTIQLIFRENLSEGVKYLESEMIKSTSQDGKQRMQSAVEKTRAEWIKIHNSMSNQN